MQVHFLCGRRDLLISEEDSMYHYELLRRVHPELGHAIVLKCGHVDFTYGMSDALVGYIVRQLPKPEPAPIEQRRRSLSMGSLRM
jgi:hypothetical protein